MSEEMTRPPRFGSTVNIRQRSTEKASLFLSPNFELTTLYKQRNLAPKEERELADSLEGTLNLGNELLQKSEGQRLAVPSFVKAGWNRSQTRLGSFKQISLE